MSQPQGVVLHRSFITSLHFFTNVWVTSCITNVKSTTIQTVYDWNKRELIVPVYRKGHHTNRVGLSDGGSAGQT